MADKVTQIAPFTGAFRRAKCPGRTNYTNLRFRSKPEYSFFLTKRLFALTTLLFLREMDCLSFPLKLAVFGR
jgi:hypothetical protein